MQQQVIRVPAEPSTPAVDRTTSDFQTPLFSIRLEVADRMLWSWLATLNY
jgi:hypothetical protein